MNNEQLHKHFFKNSTQLDNAFKRETQTNINKIKNTIIQLA
jgi:hypothetical protein